LFKPTANQTTISNSSYGWAHQKAPGSQKQIVIMGAIAVLSSQANFWAQACTFYGRVTSIVGIKMGFMGPEDRGHSAAHVIAIHENMDLGISRFTTKRKV
jgi:hypothetical protein